MRTIHIFLSYTRREEEVQQFQRVTDAYCTLLSEWAHTRGVDIFYDKSSIDQNVRYSDEDLQRIIEPAVLRSHLLVSFLSPEYVDSRWCRFEYMTKWNRARGQIHNVYWKPEIRLPVFRSLARLLRPSRSRFLSVLGWEQLSVSAQDSVRSSPMMEWLLAHNPVERNFSDVTDVYRRGPAAGPDSTVRCARKSAQILCREHPDVVGDDAPYVAPR